VVFDVVAEVERWLAAVDAGDDDQRDLRLAVVELVSNSVEHGLAGRRDGELHLTCRLTADGFAELEVDDNGQWRDQAVGKIPAVPGFVALTRGLGLPLVGQLVNDMKLDHDDTGTQVHLRRRLSRPASLSDTPYQTLPLPRLEQSLAIEVARDDASLLAVSGPVLTGTAESLRTHLDVHTGGGSRATSVDLSGVTHLSSAGVRVLQQARRAAQHQGTDLTLLAAADSTAHRVLTLIGVPHVTGQPEPR
jgi:anti-sigma regulatory factor (Ser/Thr protein kinase)/anti-anti-sigma regulatory factor